MKVAYAAAGTLVSSAGGWGYMLIAQTTGGGGDAVSTIIPATALTATSGALVWVVKQIVAGSLVHRDPATAEIKLVEVVEKLATLTETGQRNEKVLHDLLIAERAAKIKNQAESQ